MKNFLDIFYHSLNKVGEELCGDRVKIAKTPQKTWVVLSDGLGSGVKANILATLTSQIIITMLKEEARLTDVIETIIGTLPICSIREIAYATFTIIEIDAKNSSFRVINSENPEMFFLKSGGAITKLEQNTIRILEKTILVSEGKFSTGDFLAIMSDGVWYAGPGGVFNTKWGWENIAGFMADILRGHVNAAQTVVDKVLQQTNMLYGEEPGDDATFVGVYFRQCRSSMIFTGPPLNKDDDVRYVEQLLAFNGRKIVCGGTTGNLVARHLRQEIELDLDTSQEDVPPVGCLSGIDLLTEGLITLKKAIEHIVRTDGDYTKLPTRIDGSVMLALEILTADDLHFLVGLRINPSSQNPFLPESISVRKNLVEQLIHLLRDMHKDVTIEYC